MTTRLRIPKNQYALRIILYLLGILAMVMLGISVFFSVRQSQIRKTYDKVTAVTGTMDQTDPYNIKTYFTYEYDGESYSILLKGHSYWMREGNDQILYINPQNPEDALISQYLGTNAKLYKITAMICIGLFLIYLPFYLHYRKRAAKDNRILNRAAAAVTPAAEMNSDTTADMLYQLSNTDFLLPRKELMAAGRRRIISIITWLFITGSVLGVLWWCFLFKPSGRAVDLLALSLLLFLVFVLPVAGGLSQLARYKSTQSKLPGRIILYDNKLRIDSKQFTAAEIQKLTLTPANLAAPKQGTSSWRTLKLLVGSRSIEYYLGQAASQDAALAYSDYERLQEALRGWCSSNNVEFSFEFI